MKIFVTPYYKLECSYKKLQNGGLYETDFYYFRFFGRSDYLYDSGWKRLGAAYSLSSGAAYCSGRWNDSNGMVRFSVQYDHTKTEAYVLRKNKGVYSTKISSLRFCPEHLFTKGKMDCQPLRDGL